MIHKYRLLCLFGFWAYFNPGAVGLETIIGGHIADQEHFKYIVALLQEDYGHICGGSLIGDQFVLTAAHCFMYIDNTFKTKRVYALVGTNDLMKLTLPGINVAVEKVYIPNEYNSAYVNSTGDIAVLKLKNPIPTAHYIHLKVAKLERNQKNNHIDEKAIVVGWGWNHIDLQHDEVIGHRTDSLLRFTVTDILNNHQCQQEHHTSRITLAHLCARVEQTHYGISGVCRGDDGGPLVQNGFIIGVLSKFPSTCSEITSSAIYTRVSHYLRFIRNAKEDVVTIHMRAHVLDI